MDQLKQAYGAYQSAKFYFVVGLIGVISYSILAGEVGEIYKIDSRADALYKLLLLAIAIFGLTIPVFVLLERRATNKFFEWVDSNLSDLDSGALHPSGYIITWDTPLARYKVAFSAILATCVFTSRPYIYDNRSSGIAQAICMLYSCVFGWWFLGLEGITNTLETINGNTGGDPVFTLRDLLRNE